MPICLLFLGSANLCAQTKNQFFPVQSITTKADLIKFSIDTSYKSSLKRIKGKKLKEFYERRYENIDVQFKNNQFLFDDSFFSLSNEVLEEIKVSNPQSAYIDAQILISKSPVPNAYCYGNGVLVMNMGLISRLQNKDQLAFVLAHEYSHQILDHVNKRKKREIAYKGSRDYKKEVKSIEKKKYLKLEAYETFLLNEALKNSSYSRKKEKEADSLAIILLKNTSYHNDESLICLNILDHIDEEKYKDSIDFKQYLSFPEQAFESSWLRQTNGLDVEEKLDQELIDSLKTHPDCKDRISVLQKHYGLNPLQVHGVEEDFEEISILADFQLVDYFLKRHLYASSLKHSLLLLPYHPDNLFLQSVVSLSLANIYQAQKDHVLRDYVPRPDDDYDFNFQRILLMVENIRLSQLQKMSKYYITGFLSNFNQDEIESNEYLLASKVHLEKITGNKAFEETKAIYQEKYPDGYFHFYINH